MDTAYRMQYQSRRQGRMYSNLHSLDFSTGMQHVDSAKKATDAPASQSGQTPQLALLKIGQQSLDGKVELVRDQLLAASHEGSRHWQGKDEESLGRLINHGTDPYSGQVVGRDVPAAPD